MRPHSRLLGLAAVAVMALSLLGCGSNHHTTSPGTSAPTTAAATTTTTAPAATTTASPEAAIKADWAAFFSAKTPVDKRIALLQDGPRFARIIRAQAHSALASAASAKVTKVSVTSPTQAKVTYSIIVGGKSALGGQHGTAVNEGGTWKVGVGSFCGLLALENTGGKASSLPAVCRARH